MKLVNTQMTPLVNKYLHIEWREQPFLYSPYHGQPTFHAHPEYELTYIVEGHGKRIIGNSLDPFKDGDMVFLGANVPHIWMSDPAYYEEGAQLVTRAIVAYINPAIFEQMFEMMEEFEPVRQMISQASGGFSVMGKSKQKIAGKLIELLSVSGYKRIEGFLNVLHTLAETGEKVQVSDNKTAVASGANADRLVPVVQYIRQHLHEAISLNLLADLAYMTVPSFCRFFKSRMGISPLQYISEERMELARKLLIELDKPVYEIAGLCGYNSDSHFCKLFKAHAGMSPYQYKSKVKRVLAMAAL